jgi:pimeloyl-ACP methyl ester carboxylesterase
MIQRRQLLAALLALCCAPLAPAAFALDFASNRISVKSEGAGSDVVLIHGLGSSPRVWAELIKAVPDHRYHLVQISGFAGQPSEGNTNGVVSAPVAEEIARYIAEAGLKNPAVIGHSMGGTIAMMIAARHPQALSKLMVLDMLPFLGVAFGPPGTTVKSIQPAAQAILEKMRIVDPAGRKQRTEASIGGMINTVAMQPAAIEDSLKSDADVLARAFYELLVTDLRPELAKVTVPTTVLYVLPKSLPVSEAVLDAVYQAEYAQLKGVVLKRIPQSAHFIMWDQPEAFQSEVKAFLN